MSIKLMSQIFDYQMPELKTNAGKVVSASTATFVLLALADHANDDGENIYPSLSLLERKTKLSRQTVITAIKALLENGYIAKAGKSRRGTSEYIMYPEQVILDRSTHLTRVVNPLDQASKPTIPEPSYNHNKPSEPINLSEDPTYEPCDDDGLPVKEKKARKVNPENARATEIATVLAEVTGLSMAINRPILYKIARKISLDERVTTDLIKEYYAPGGLWYQKDWRGKQNQKPLLHQIPETLFTYGGQVDDTIKADMFSR